MIRPPLEDMLKSVEEWSGGGREAARVESLPADDLQTLLANATDPKVREAIGYEITMGAALRWKAERTASDKAKARKRAIDRQLEIAALKADGEDVIGPRHRAKVVEAYEAIRVCMA